MKLWTTKRGKIMVTVPLCKSHCSREPRETTNVRHFRRKRRYYFMIFGGYFSTHIYLESHSRNLGPRKVFFFLSFSSLILIVRIARFSSFLISNNKLVLNVFYFFLIACSWSISLELTRHLASYASQPLAWKKEKENSFNSFFLLLFPFFWFRDHYCLLYYAKAQSVYYIYSQSGKQGRLAGSIYLFLVSTTSSSSSSSHQAKNHSRKE